MAQYGCDFFAVLECVDTKAAQTLYQMLKPKLYTDMSCPGQSSINITDVYVEDRVLRVSFIGDAIAGYCVFFKWAEDRGDSVAFLRIGAEYELPAWDPLETVMLNDLFSMQCRSEYYCKSEDRLINSFITRVSMATYSDEFIRRVISMCRLGKDRNNAEHYALLHFHNYTSGLSKRSERMEFWRSGIQRCHMGGDNSSVWYEGDNLLVRVLGHLVYAEDLNNTSIVTKFKNRGRGLRSMSLT